MTLDALNLKISPNTIQSHNDIVRRPRKKSKHVDGIVRCTRSGKKWKKKHTLINKLLKIWNNSSETQTNRKALKNNSVFCFHTNMRFGKREKPKPKY